MGLFATSSPFFLSFIFSSPPSPLSSLSLSHTHTMSVLASTHTCLSQAFQEGWDAMRQALSQFYARFYGALLIGIIAIYQLRNNPAALILLLYSFWVPQIIYNAAMGHRRPMLPIYIAGMSAARLVFPLYLLGCPSNFFHNQPSLPLALLCVAWVGGQAMILICQRMWGPRFFVPARILPKSYDYYRSLPSLDGADCAICMAAVGPGGVRGEADGDRVTTPCDHAFHLACFKVSIPASFLELPLLRLRLRLRLHSAFSMFGARVLQNFLFFFSCSKNSIFGHGRCERC